MHCKPTHVGHQPYAGAKSKPDERTENLADSKSYQSKRASNEALGELLYPKVM